MAAIALDRSRTPPRSAGRPATRPAAPPWGRLQAQAAQVPSQRRSPVVYRRRRVAAVALLVAVAFTAGAVLALLVASPAGGSLTPEAVESQRVSYVVGPGDTLWGVAKQVAPDDDPRAVVDALVEARGGTTLIPGEVVAWPPR